MHIIWLWFTTDSIISMAAVRHADEWSETVMLTTSTTGLLVTEELWT